jgi:hypothetical protein
MIELPIILIIEGDDSFEVTEDLMEDPDLSGACERIDGEGERDGGGTLATVATIVGIISGGMTIGEKLHKWHQKYQQPDSSARIEKVLIERADGSRLLMKDVSVEQIDKFLKP